MDGTQGFVQVQETLQQPNHFYSPNLPFKSWEKVHPSMLKCLRIAQEPPLPQTFLAPLRRIPPPPFSLHSFISYLCSHKHFKAVFWVLKGSKYGSLRRNATAAGCERQLPETSDTSGFQGTSMCNSPGSQQRLQLTQKRFWKACRVLEGLLKCHLDGGGGVKTGLPLCPIQ